MIPIGALGAAAAAFRGGHVRISRGDVYVLNFMVRFIAWVVLGAYSAALGDVVPWAGRAMFAVLVLWSCPAIVLRAVIVPLGWPRVAYWFAVLSPPIAHSAEVRGGAALAAALAIGRGRAIDLAVVAWVDRQLSWAKKPRSLSIVAAGLLAAARGNQETARRLLYAVEGVSTRAPRLARRVARSWLVADAAQRGDWSEVVALGRGAYMRWPYAMGAIAGRITFDADSPSALSLWVAWLIAPHRRATYPMLRRALSVRRPTSAPDEVAKSNDADPISVALEAHAECLRHPREGTVVAAARAWDAMQASPVARATLGRRALALETRTSAEDGNVPLIAET